MKKLRLYIDTSVLSTNIRMGYNSIEIISPEEVTGDGEVEI